MSLSRQKRVIKRSPLMNPATIGIFSNLDRFLGFFGFWFFCWGGVGALSVLLFCGQGIKTRSQDSRLASHSFYSRG